MTLQAMQALREEIERQKAELTRAVARHDLKQAGQIQYALIPTLEKKLEQLSRLH